MAALSGAAHDFKGSLVLASKTFRAGRIVLSAAMLSEEVRAAAGRALNAAWTAAYDSDPSIHPALLASRIAKACKVTRNQALTAGARLRSGGGMWPWTSQNGGGPESWPQFVEARSDQELEELAKEWQGRMKAAVGADARMVIESNVRRLLSTLEARKQARGCYARLVGSPDPLGAYWALHAADGSVVIRSTIRNILGARRDAIAVKWASSPEYGARLAASAASFGFGKIKASMAPQVPRLTATAGVPDSMLRQYLETALWSSTDGEEPMDSGRDFSDFSPEAVEKAREDIATFLDEAGALLDGVEADNEQIGHDLWLTRNGHGAGFWDRPELYKDQETADRLTELAHALGESYPTVDDQEKIQLYGFKASDRKAVIADLAEKPDEGIRGAWTMEDSAGAASHGYRELDFECYISIGGREPEEFTPEENEKLQKVEDILKAEKWTYGGTDGYFMVRTDYEDVKSGDLDDFIRTQGAKLAARAEELLKAEFGDDVELDEA